MNDHSSIQITDLNVGECENTESRNSRSNIRLTCSMSLDERAAQEALYSTTDRKVVYKNELTLDGRVGIRAPNQILSLWLTDGGILTFIANSLVLWIVLAIVISIRQTTWLPSVSESTLVSSSRYMSDNSTLMKCTNKLIGDYWYQSDNNASTSYKNVNCQWINGYEIDDKNLRLVHNIESCPKFDCVEALTRLYNISIYNYNCYLSGNMTYAQVNDELLSISCPTTQHEYATLDNSNILYLVDVAMAAGSVAAKELREKMFPYRAIMSGIVFFYVILALGLVFFIRQRIFPTYGSSLSVTNLLRLLISLLGRIPTEIFHPLNTSCCCKNQCSSYRVATIPRIWSYDTHCLIDLQKNELVPAKMVKGITPRLAIVRNGRLVCIPYYAVSHVWADGIFPEGMIHSCMYTRLRNIGDILGLRYVWIDAYCLQSVWIDRKFLLPELGLIYSGASAVVIITRDGCNDNVDLECHEWSQRMWNVQEAVNARILYAIIENKIEIQKTLMNKYAKHKTYAERLCLLKDRKSYGNSAGLVSWALLGPQLKVQNVSTLLTWCGILLSAVLCTTAAINRLMLQGEIYWQIIAIIISFLICDVLSDICARPPQIGRASLSEAIMKADNVPSGLLWDNGIKKKQRGFCWMPENPTTKMLCGESLILTRDGIIIDAYTDGFHVYSEENNGKKCCIIHNQKFIHHCGCQNSLGIRSNVVIG